MTEFGHIFLAQNSDIDYVRQAYALALSIKKNNKINNTCLVTNDKVPLNYSHAFDHIIQVPWGDAAGDSIWKIENRWKLIYATPFKYNLVYDTDMLVLTSNDHWWNFLENKSLVFTSNIYDYRGNIIKDNFYRRTFEENNLPNLYFGLHYFKKDRTAFEFYKWLEVIVKNWKHTYAKYTPEKTQKFCSMDVSSAIAVKLLDAKDQCIIDSATPSFTHMKPAIQGWGEFSEQWTNEVSSTFTTDCNLKVANCLQTGVFHYTEDQFLTDDIIRKLEVANGR